MKVTACEESIYCDECCKYVKCFSIGVHWSSDNPLLCKKCLRTLKRMLDLIDTEGD